MVSQSEQKSDKHLDRLTQKPSIETKKISFLLEVQVSFGGNCTTFPTHSELQNLRCLFYVKFYGMLNDYPTIVQFINVFGIKSQRLVSTGKADLIKGRVYLFLTVVQISKYCN